MRSRALLTFLGLVMLVAAAGWMRGIGGAEALSKSMHFSSTSSPAPPPLLLRSGTVDVRPGRGLMATRLR